MPPTTILNPAISILHEAMADADARVQAFTNAIDTESPYITEKMRREYRRLREDAATERTSCAEALSLLQGGTP